MAPESIRNSSFSVTSGIAGFPPSISNTITITISYYQPHRNLLSGRFFPKVFGLELCMPRNKIEVRIHMIKGIARTDGRSCYYKIGWRYCDTLAPEERPQLRCLQKGFLFQR